MKATVINHILQKQASVKKRTHPIELRKLIPTAIALIFGVLMILPFIWMLSTSVKTPLEVFDYPIKWIPISFNGVIISMFGLVNKTLFNIIRIH